MAGEINGVYDIFLHDRQSATTRISMALAGAQANNTCYSPSNLVAGDTNALQDIFIHDRQTGTTSRVSVATGGAQASGDGFEAAWAVRPASWCTSPPRRTSRPTTRTG